MGRVSGPGVGGGGGGGGVTSHGLLSGLSADDHPHYLTEARADALYVPTADLVTAHADLTGLDEDDHVQYLLKSDNLAALANITTARANLGLGSAAEADALDFETAGAAAAAVLAHLGVSDPHGTLVDAIALLVAHEGASDPHPGYLTEAAAASTYQPVDTDLTNIAALSTQAFGRGLLEHASASAVRSALSLVIGTDVQAFDADLSEIAGLPNVRGDILVTDSTPAWARLAKGSDGQLLGWNANDAIATSRFGRIAHNDNGASISNSSAEASLLSSTLTIPANTLVVGDVILVIASGNMLNNTGSNRTVTFQIGPDVGSTQTFPTGNIATGTTTRMWEMVLAIRVEQLGAATASMLSYKGHLAISGVGGSTSWDTLSATGYYYIMNGASTWGTTTDAVFDFRAALSAADANLSIDVDSYSLALLPKAA